VGALLEQMQQGSQECMDTAKLRQRMNAKAPVLKQVLNRMT